MDFNGTGEGARRIFEAGADGVKVGVGPGAACLTRINAGVGYPQLDAVLECSRVAREMGRFIVADGGVSTSGNFAKAVAAGASLVMMGSVFAGS
jgi:IMP dehydrogenase